MRYSRLLGLMLLCAFAGNTLAQTTTVPNTFTPGTPARAAEVNENFQTLATAINNLAARVTKLEGGPTTDADVIGTYKASNLQIGLLQVANVANQEVEAISYEGTITFAANHTFSFTFAGKENDADGPDTDNGTVNGTWSLANNDVTASLAGEPANTLHCASGCRILFGTLYGASSGPNTDGHNNMMILVRTTN